MAQSHPRKRLRINQSFDVTPLALIHPRNLDSPQRTRPPRPASPSGIAISKISRPSSALLPFAQPDPRKPLGFNQSLVFTPFAQPHPRNAVTPLPAAFSYCWPPAGVFEVLATLRPWSGLVPFAQAHPRKLSGLSQSLNFTPFAQPQPRKKTSGRGFRAFRVSTLPSGIPSVNDGQTSSLPFVLLYPRKPLVSGVLQSNVETSYASLPLALVHPRNKQSARARSAVTSKTPARCRRYENPLLIVTPRLEIAATTSKSKTMQKFNRYKMRVLRPPSIDAARRKEKPASSLALKIPIANLELEFGLTHTKLSPLRISNRKYFAVFHSDLLHRREKSGRPTTSDRAVVATAAYAAESAGD